MRNLFGLSIIVAGVAFGQGPGTQVGSPGGRGSASPFAGMLVTGAPYSADEVVETVSPASGTAASPQAGRVYRDSAGRTRTERPMGSGPGAMSGSAGGTVIEINDPVAGARWTLDAESKVAHKQLIPPIARFLNGRMPAGFAGGAPTMAPPPPPGGLGAPTQMGTSGVPGAPNAPVSQPEVTTEKLGTKTIEGLAAEGTRRSATIPAQGGDKPVVTVSEIWFSQELQVTVLAKETDPRLGERTTRLTHLTRSEPAAALFTPPADYKVVEDRGSLTMPPAPRQ